MSLPRYLSYKAESADWLGDIPNHWDVCKFRHVFTESSEKIDGTIVGVMLSVSGYRGVEIKEYDDENRRRLDEDLIGYRIVRPGQLVVNTMWLNYAGLGVSEHEGYVSPAYRSYDIAEGFNKRFIHHMMRSESFVRGYTKYLTGIRPNSLQMSRDDLMAFSVLKPPVQEQDAIADFLDRETAKIDALIAEQEKLIALLAEKRQATIFRAVTRGLDPNVPLKDSGVPWLGKVPAHWRVARLSYFARVENGTTPSRAIQEYWDNGDVPWLASGEVNQFYIESSSEFITKKALNECSLRLLPVGTIVIGMVGQGKTRGLPGMLKLPAAINQNLAAISLGSSLDSDYVLFVMLAAYEWIRESGRGGNQAAMNCEIISALRIPVPAIDEQRNVAHFIKAEIARLDTLRQRADSAITLLKERRAALISAAVTGKIDVRGLAA